MGDKINPPVEIPAVLPPTHCARESEFPPTPLYSHRPDYLSVLLHIQLPMFSSAPIHPQQPAILPEPCYAQCPANLCDLIDKIQDTLGLEDTDRLVLTGVLHHLPVTPASPITAICTLSPAQLKLLADVFTAGLLDVKSWGERHDGLSTYVQQTTGDLATGSPELPELTDSALGKLFESLKIPPFPIAHAIVPDCDMTEDPQNRSEKHAANCIAREKHVCPITSRSLVLETAQLVPHSVARATAADMAFWLLAAVVLGPPLRDHLYSIIGGARSYSTTNGLALDPSLHQMYDKGTVLLLPQFTHFEKFNPDTCWWYDVTFRWRANMRDLGLWMTHLPQEPGDQTLVATDGQFSRAKGIAPRSIANGDMFRLWTNDPIDKPLPHPFLLSMHAMFWRMIGAAGLAAPKARMKRRFSAFANPDSDDDDDSDDGETPRPPKRQTRHHEPEEYAAPGVSGKHVHWFEPVDSISASVSDCSSPRVYTPPIIPAERNTSPLMANPSTTSGMSYMQQAYLDFRLRQVAADADRRWSKTAGSDEESGTEEGGQEQEESDEEMEEEK